MNSTTIDLLLRMLALWGLAATVALVVIALLRPVVRKAAGARAVLRLWWILPLALLITAWPKEVRVAVPVAAESFQILDMGIPAAQPPAVRIDEAAPVAAPHAAPRADMSLSPAAMLAIWVMGAVLLSAWLGWAQWRYERSIAWQGQRGTLPSEHMPAVIGLWSPRLVLPVDFASRFTPDERRLIRLHEAVHQLRRDGLASLAMSVLRVVLWFHPLVHWAAGALSDDQEAACDEVVVTRHPQQVRMYAQALVRSAESAPLLRAPLVSQWLAFHPVVKRVARLKHYQQQKPHRIFASIILLAGGLSSAALVYALQPEKVVNVAVPVPGTPMSTLDTDSADSAGRPRWARMLEPVLQAARAPATHAAAAPAVQSAAIPAMGEPEAAAPSSAAVTTSTSAEPPAPPVVRDPRVSLVSDPSDAPATSDASKMNYVTLEVRSGDRLIASPALVVMDGRAAAIKIEDGGNEPVQFRVTPRREDSGGFDVKLEMPANYPASNQVSIKSAALRMSPKLAQRVKDDGGMRLLNLVVLPGEQAVVRFGHAPEDVEWRLRVFPVPRFAATNGTSGTEISALSAFVCPGAKQTLLPRVMRLLGEDAQVNVIYRDNDSGMLKLVGVARSLKRMSELLKGLGTDRAFRNVSLLSAVRDDKENSQFQIELGLNCEPPTQANAASTELGTTTKTRPSTIGVNMHDVKLPVLVGVLGDKMGRKLRGVESMPAELVRLNAMPVDVAQALGAVLGCAGHQVVQEGSEWWVRPDASRVADPDLNACMARNVKIVVPTPASTSRISPAALGGSFNVTMRVDMGKGLYSNYVQNVTIGEVIRLPIAQDAALVCALMNVADRLHLRCTENQDGLPLPTKHVVMKQIDSDAPLQFEVSTSRGNFPTELTVKERLPSRMRTG